VLAEDDDVMPPEGGVIFKGSKGALMCDVYGNRPRLISESAMQAYKRPPKTLPRVKGSHEMAWVNAAKAGQQPGAHFGYSGPLTETCLLGNIAKRVHSMVAAMGATVLHTSTRDDGRPDWRPLPELLAASDVVSLHLPLTAGTRHLLDRKTIARMKPHAVLINTSRGAVVDEDALVDALRGGRLAAAGLDVFEVEPVAPDNPLLGLDNVVLTPHVTWSTADTMRRYLAEAVANCRRLRDGQPAAHVVNQPPGC